MRPAWAIVALVVAAAIQLVITLAPDAYSIFGPYLLVDAPIVRGALESIVPFGLAAAVLVGANRWDVGRLHLRRGAAALAVAGVAQLISDVVLAEWTATGDAMSGTSRLALPALFILRTAAMGLAFALLAGGLWADRRGRDEPADARRGARAWAVAVAVLGGVCAVATAWTALSAGDAPAEFVIVIVIGVLLQAAGIGALALLAIAALRSIPAMGPLPELLIAVGSTIAMVGLTGQWLIPYAFPTGSPPALEPVLTVVGWSRVLGFVTLAAGFLTAAGTERATRVQPA